ncbi:MAG: serine/threonine protein kinase, partial [Gammaproteobacteria bacterium]|nr:serine/threonine protein kinase [Gammaproteobacteria bacterium]
MSRHKIPIEDLPHTGRKPPAPVCIVLGEDNQLDVDRWLRILPGKRYVGRAIWKGRQVLVKLFVGPKATKMATAERDGIKKLCEATLPTPELLDVRIQKEAAWAITAFFPQARSLSEVAELSVEGYSRLPFCPSALLEATKIIAAMHNARLIQQDIHPNNLLYNEGQCLLVDAAEVQSIDQSKSFDQSTHNLGK